MERTRETEGEAEAKNKPWSASQSRSHKGDEALRVYVYVCVRLKGKTVGWEAYIVKNEWLVEDFMGDGWRKEEEEGERESQRWKELVIWLHNTPLILFFFNMFDVLRGNGGTCVMFMSILCLCACVVNVSILRNRSVSFWSMFSLQSLSLIHSVAFFLLSTRWPLVSRCSSHFQYVPWCTLLRACVAKIKCKSSAGTFLPPFLCSERKQTRGRNR